MCTLCLASARPPSAFTFYFRATVAKVLWRYVLTSSSLIELHRISVHLVAASIEICTEPGNDNDDDDDDDDTRNIVSTNYYNVKIYLINQQVVGKLFDITKSF